ncbi:lipopolysaccharide biosynthesis protein [Glutamicibacter ardleyensis]|uniref:lipopolysaccharide biosynthesis protein n=1 Tax=Glutamicibacter ardleyensis TaxID=225894 RepID=UPI003FD0EFD0
MKRFFHQVSWVTTGQILAATMQLITLILIMRSISPGAFGLVSSVLGVGVTLQAIFDLGLSKYIIREHAYGSRHKQVAAALRINSFSSTVLVFVVSASLIVASLTFEEQLLLLLPLSLVFGLEKNADTWIGVALAEGKANLSAVNMVIRRASSLFIFSLLLFVDFNPILSFSIALAVGAFISMIFARRMVNRLIDHSHRAHYKLIIRDASAYYINGLSVQIRNIDILIITIFANPVLAGHYAAVKRISSPMAMIPTALAAVLLPMVSRSGPLQQARVPRGILIISLLSLLPFIGISLLLPLIIPLVLGEGYIAAILPMQVLVASLSVPVAGSLCTSYLQGIGHARSTASIAGVCTVFFLVGVSFAAYNESLWIAVLILTTTPIIQLILQAMKIHAIRKNSHLS